jgi:deoxyribose-phosphate aldolase
MEIINRILDQAKEYMLELPPAPTMFKLPSVSEIAGWIDHTLLKPDSTSEQIEQLCKEAREYKFAAVCVNPVYVPLVAGLLKGTGVKISSVAGFPLGANSTSVKAFETILAIHAGATEIDMVMNIGALKGEAYGQVYNDIYMVSHIAHNEGAIVKVILEMALLTKPEKIISCLISKSAGADFVKTSSGFGPGGAQVEDVNLMYRLVGNELKIKAAGGIRSYNDATLMIMNGASRIGTSAGIQIVQEAAAVEGN